MLARQGPHLHQSLRPVRLALAGAQARGDWDGTKDLILKGRDWIVERDEGLGPARPRRRRLPDRAQMVLHAEGRATGRATSSSTPTRASPAPARIATSCATIRTSWSRAACSPASPWARTPATSISAASSTTRRSNLQAAIDEAYEAGLHRQERLRLGLRFRSLSPSRRRRLYLRRGNGAARKPRGQEGPAAPEAAVPGRRRPLWLPDHGQQRRDASRSRRPSCAAARRGSPASAGRRTPAPRSSASPAT